MNMIWILADDLGYADLGCYGGRDASFGAVSPRLDQLAAQGLRFTDAYSNSPVCSPTRFALMTGRYQYRLRGAAEEPINSKAAGNPALGLPPSHPTLPSLLAQAGYRTGLIGKWHLGFLPHFSPIRSGYQHFFGPMAGGVDYFSHCNASGQHDLWLGEQQHRESGYLTDLISRKAIDFVKASLAANQPFFLSLHYTAPHWPWEAREDAALSDSVKDNLFHLDGGSIETYRRMIHHMDEGIGALVDCIDRLGAAQDTLIVFSSDNGGERYSDNWPHVGGKMDLSEGGIRVPWIVRWTGQVPAASLSAQTCITMDFSASFLDAAGVKAHPQFERPLFWRMKHRNQAAHRKGTWKYLKIDHHEYLFDLEHDPRERANLRDRHPDQFQSMKAAWQAWDATMPEIPDGASVSLGYGLESMPAR
ncbi:MAG: twin-arginine translocation pathway signal protein [Betaproteobacteria bacterium]|nr:twin-arginine translocation pathway signal protein [Betaproteobacteria bacterium]